MQKRKWRLSKDYAAAIRYGIEQGNRHNYGDINDPYYEARDKVNWYSDLNSTLDELAMKAFDRTTAKRREEAEARMSEAELDTARKVFAKRWVEFRETRSERELRLIREEVQAIRQELNDNRVRR